MAFLSTDDALPTHMTCLPRRMFHILSISLLKWFKLAIQFKDKTCITNITGTVTSEWILSNEE